MKTRATTSMPAAPSAPEPLRQGSSSLVGQATSQEKLNGKVYTPLPVATRLLDQVSWPAGAGALLDPSCGEGVFLEAAMAKAARLLTPVGAAEAVARRLVGWELDPCSLDRCTSRLMGVSAELGLGGALPRLVHRDAVAPQQERFTCVIGNPPYLEAKRMPAALKAGLRTRYPLSTKGAFDLYGVFIEMAWGALAAGGEICLLVPNRFLVARYGGPLRALFLREAQVTVTDLSTARIFEDAAVYPMVLHARRRSPPSYRAEDWSRRLAPVSLDVGVLRDRLQDLMPLPPTTPAGRALFARLLEDPSFKPLGATMDCRWCVSFHRGGLRQQFTSPDRPPGPHARPFLGGGSFMGNREVQQYGISWSGWWIDYDQARARAEGNALPPMEIFRAPKVVVCQNARRCRASLDREGIVLKDTFLSLRARRGEDDGSGWLEWVTMYLNSSLFHYLYEHLYGGTRKGGAYLHFLPAYLSPFPVPPPTDLERARRLHERIVAGDADPSEADDLVAESAGLTAEEAALVAAHALDCGP